MCTLATAQARAWIEAVLAKPAGEEGDSLSTALKSGVLLCELLNTVSPGAVKKAGKMNVAGVHRENIELFVGGCRKLGVPDANNFETADLYEERNLIQVRALHRLCSLCYLSPVAGLCAGAGVAVRGVGWQPGLRVVRWPEDGHRGGDEGRARRRTPDRTGNAAPRPR